MPVFEPPLANVEDFQLPQCLPDADAAIAVIREDHARWLQGRSGEK
jgi:hypothetical protein